MPSKVAIMGRAASAGSDASEGHGASSSAMKSVGWSTVTTGPATRFASGATMLSRPKCHATRGAVTTLAMVEVTSDATTTRIQRGRSRMGKRCASSPAATSAAKPLTLSW